MLEADNTWFTLLTMNVQQVHFDAAYAAKSEWKKQLVNSAFTLALLTGMSVRTVDAPFPDDRYTAGPRAFRGPAPPGLPSRRCGR